MSKTYYVVGNVYYELGLAHQTPDGDSVPITNSYRFDGVHKLEFTLPDCDVPYHFLCFTRVIGACGSSEKAPLPTHVYVASNEKAQLSMLSWRDFRLRAIEFGESGGACYEDPEIDGGA